jgi:agmatinase
MKLLHALPPYNFCGVEEKGFDECKIVVLPVPYDSTTSYNSGARNGPHAIIQASRNMEWYDEEIGKSPAEVGIFTLDEMEPSMKSPEDMVARVQEAVAEILEAEKFPIVFGGEHSISLGAVRAVNEKIEGVSVLHLDAHADCRDKYEGTKYNHACVARRFSELCPVVQVGVRSMSEEEAGFLSESENVKTFFMHDLRKDGLQKTIERVNSMLSEKVYISLDIDVMDPSEVPATGTPEPGGLKWNEVLDILKAVCTEKEVVGFDLVELAPIPGNPASDFLASKLAYKFIAYEFKDQI